MSIATKEEERKALAQIGKIIDGLGENSYVGTAFAGCFDIAADNIENDFGNSLQAKLDNAYAQYAQLPNFAGVQRLRPTFYSAFRFRKQTQNAAFRYERFAERRQLKKMILPPSVLQETVKILKDVLAETEADIIVASQTMCLNDPAGAVFAQALQKNKVLLGRYNKINAILSDLDTFEKRKEEKENENRIDNRRHSLPARLRRC